MHLALQCGISRLLLFALSSIVICTGAWLIVVCLLNSQLSSNPKEMEMEIEIRHKNLFHVNLIINYVQLGPVFET